MAVGKVNVGSGGGIKLVDVKVQATKPISPKDKTFWIEEDTWKVASLYIQDTEPENPKENEVWITTLLSESTRGFRHTIDISMSENFHSKQRIIHLLIYRNGQWESPKTQCYINGEWKKVSGVTVSEIVSDIYYVSNTQLFRKDLVTSAEVPVVTLTAGSVGNSATRYPRPYLNTNGYLFILGTGITNQNFTLYCVDVFNGVLTWSKNLGSTIDASNLYINMDGVRGGGVVYYISTGSAADGFTASCQYFVEGSNNPIAILTSSGSSAAHSMATYKDELLLAQNTASSAGNNHIYQIADDGLGSKKFTKIAGVSQSATCAKFTPDGRLYLKQNGSINLYLIDTTTWTSTMLTLPTVVSSIQFFTVDNDFIYMLSSATLYKINLATMQIIYTLTLDSTKFGSVLVRPGSFDVLPDGCVIVYSATKVSLVDTNGNVILNESLVNAAFGYVHPLSLSNIYPEYF